AFVAEAENKVLVPEVGVVFHQVPENRPRPDLHHGFGDVVNVPPEPHADSTTKEHHFHHVPPCLLPQDMASFSLGTTKQPPHSQMYCPCCIVASYRLQGRLKA